MSRPGRVLLYTQHLLGVGHLKRALVIAGALTQAGLTVRVASGGVPAPVLSVDGVDVFQLPAIRAGDARFSHLVDTAGIRIDEAFKADRRDRLLQLFRSFAPDALLIEAFPFGRRQLRFELIPLLDEAVASPARPLILCSVRDIVQRKQDPVRLQEQLATARRFFDRILVHGDPELVRFEESFPPSCQLADRIVYTGYVCDPAPVPRPPQGHRPGEALVSVGGGAVGSELLKVALAARTRSRLEGARWRLLAGGDIPSTVFDELRNAAPEKVVVERARTDFSALLATAAISISQCGYNTMMDVIRCGVPSVVVPFRGSGETEQALRAEKLRSRGLVRVVDEGDLSPPALAAAIDAAVESGRPDGHGLDLSGASRTAHLIANWLGEGL